jgi:hypothetical protein
MNENLKLLSSIIISSICFFLAINTILFYDELTINSFNILFYKTTNEELTFLFLGINLIFYSYIIFLILQSKKNCIKSKFEFFQLIIFTILLIYTPYVCFLIFDSEIHQHYTDILFLIYISFFIFGFFLFTSLSISILINNKLKKSF